MYSFDIAHSMYANYLTRVNTRRRGRCECFTIFNTGISLIWRVDARSSTRANALGVNAERGFTVSF